jgi:hypothetical protein
LHLLPQKLIFLRFFRLLRSSSARLFFTVFFPPSRSMEIIDLRRCRSMRRPLTKRKCQHCKTFFDPDPRSAGRQRYCSEPACRQASKAHSQRRWLHQPGNRDYFSGPTHVERVRQWRQHHPGYWRRKASRAPEALQEPFTPQEPQKQHLGEGLAQEALQDSFFLQPAIFVGLIAQLTGLSLQDDIAVTARRLQQLGHDILCGSPQETGGMQDAQTPHFFGQTQAGPQPVQLGGSALGP